NLGPGDETVIVNFPPSANYFIGIGVRTLNTAFNVTINVTILRTSSPGPCSTSDVSATNTTIPGSGGKGTIQVTIDRDCSWKAISDAPWLTVDPPPLGSATISFTAAPNTGPQRQGKITAVGKPVIVTQGAGQTYVPPNALTMSQFVGGGKDWASTITLTNVSLLPENFTLRFHGDDGLPLDMPMVGLGTVSSITGTLKPDETKVYTTDAIGTLKQGWVFVIPETLGAQRLTGFGVFKQTLPTVTSEVAVGFTGTGTSRSVLLYDNRNGYEIGVALGSLDPLNETRILVDIRDEDGTLLGLDAIKLPPLGHAAYVLSQRLPLTAGRRGSVHLTSSPAAFTGLGLRFSPTLGITSFPLLTSPDIR
ncbi:MAG: BACON domain-containing protein, partial [Acidobacteriota bacterium]